MTKYTVCTFHLLETVSQKHLMASLGPTFFFFFKLWTQTLAVMVQHQPQTGLDQLCPVQSTAVPVYVLSPSIYYDWFNTLQFWAGLDATVAFREHLSSPWTLFSLQIQPHRLSKGTSMPEQHRPCRHRSDVRSKGKWPRQRHSSRWRWSARTGAPRQSSETEGDRWRLKCIYIIVQVYYMFSYQ